MQKRRGVCGGRKDAIAPPPHPPRRPALWLGVLICGKFVKPADARKQMILNTEKVSAVCLPFTACYCYRTNVGVLPPVVPNREALEAKAEEKQVFYSNAGSGKMADTCLKAHPLRKTEKTPAVLSPTRTEGRVQSSCFQLPSFGNRSCC